MPEILGKSISSTTTSGSNSSTFLSVSSPSFSMIKSVLMVEHLTLFVLLQQKFHYCHLHMDQPCLREVEHRLLLVLP